jgi:hypothetical protein
LGNRGKERSVFRKLRISLLFKDNLCAWEFPVHLSSLLPAQTQTLSVSHASHEGAVARARKLGSARIDLVLKIAWSPPAEVGSGKVIGAAARLSGTAGVSRCYVICCKSYFFLFLPLYDMLQTCYVICYQKETDRQT